VVVLVVEHIGAFAEVEVDSLARRTTESRVRLKSPGRAGAQPYAPRRVHENPGVMSTAG